VLTPAHLWQAWTLEPSLLIGLSLTTLLYAAGVRQVWMRAGIGHGISMRRCACFAGALGSLVVALVSPLDALSEALFSAHMVQHLVLILVAAPLLVMSDWPLALLWALPRAAARAFSLRITRSPRIVQGWRWLTHPASAWLAFALALWLWHAPLLFESALRDASIHAIEHLVLLAAAMLFWWLLLKQTGPDHVRYGIAVPYLFTTAIHSAVLGALMTFSAQAWYPFYAPFVAVWGYTPLEDQQLAGLVMWIPGGFVFTLLTIVYFAAWFNALEKRSMGQA
jgi:putative membrane protein